MQKDTIVIGIIVFLVLWGLIEQKQLGTTKYTMISNKLPKQLNGTSFVVLADLHNRTFGKNNERLIKRINKLKPEFIIAAGDMINKKEVCNPRNAFTLLDRLAKQYKIYYAYGNHEQRIEQIHLRNLENKDLTADNIYTTWVEFKERLEKSSVKFLNNESDTLILKGTNLRITGISIGSKYFVRNKIPDMEKGYINSLIGERQDKDYQLLIAHNPVYFKDYADWGADLTISGHLHGGMVRLPGIGGVISPQAKFFPKYQSGNHTENGQEIVVSRGLGSHSIMSRLFNIPEVVYVKLINKIDRI